MSDNMDKRRVAAEEAPPAYPSSAGAGAGVTYLQSAGSVSYAQPMSESSAAAPAYGHEVVVARDIYGRPVYNQAPVYQAPVYVPPPVIYQPAPVPVETRYSEHHSHALERNQPHTYYPDGAWRCRVCNQTFSSSSYSVWRCSSCNWASCESCLSVPVYRPPVVIESPPESRYHSNHSHPLYLTNSRAVYTRSSGTWRCNVCRSTYTSSSATWHCGRCNYDVCEPCMNNQYVPPPVVHRPIYVAPRGNSTRHHHRLSVQDSWSCYPSAGGNWQCDLCRVGFSTANTMWHCGSCNFDLCDSCMTATKTGW